MGTNIKTSFSKIRAMFATFRSSTIVVVNERKSSKHSITRRLSIVINILYPVMTDLLGQTVRWSQCLWGVGVGFGGASLVRGILVGLKKLWP